MDFDADALLRSLLDRAINLRASIPLKFAEPNTDLVIWLLGENDAASHILIELRMWLQDKVPTLSEKANTATDILNTVLQGVNNSLNDLSNCHHTLCMNRSFELGVRMNGTSKVYADGTFTVETPTAEAIGLYLSRIRTVMAADFSLLRSNAEEMVAIMQRTYLSMVRNRTRIEQAAFGDTGGHEAYV